MLLMPWFYTNSVLTTVCKVIEGLRLNIEDLREFERFKFLKVIGSKCFVAQIFAYDSSFMISEEKLSQMKNILEIHKNFQSRNILLAR